MSRMEIIVIFFIAVAAGSLIFFMGHVAGLLYCSNNTPASCEPTSCADVIDRESVK